MAFVFRSQKQSVFDTKKQQIHSTPTSTLSNQQSQLNGTSYNNSPPKNQSNSPSKIFKGLPSLLKKDKSRKSQEYQHHKQNQVIYQTKPQKVKVNLQKLKKINENYFFSSNVVRDSNSPVMNKLDKYQTCSEFKTPPSEQISILNDKKGFLTNYTTTKFVVNKNIMNNTNSNLQDLRKLQTQINIQNDLSKKLIVNCSKENDFQIKRKCSPPRVSDNSQNSIAKKTKMTNNKSIQKIPTNSTQIYMQSSLESIKKPIFKSKTQKKLMKLHKGNLQTSFYKQDSDSQQQQYQQCDQTPGPGTYNNIIDLKQKKSFRSRKQKFAKIFVSPLQRFKTQDVKYHQITYVNQDKPEKICKNQGFLSRSPKFMSLQKKSASPQPGSYNPRSTLEHEIVRNLLRNANIASFNSTLPRFNYQKTTITPGPGQYNIDSLQKARLQELRNQMSSCYKSQVQRCLDYGQNYSFKKQESFLQRIQTLTDQEYQKSVIHKRQQHFNTDQFFSPPPFLSGVQRFQHKLAQSTQLSPSPKIDQKRLLKQIKNIQPFNSSEKRKFIDKVGQGVGVGLYRVQRDKWNKRSYNVHFH